MAYFIPSSIQKRLLRYALSRLELLDTDALDLESLEIGWGRRSTVELRAVNLRKAKLASLLHLPSTLSIEQAQIGLLRVTVPADLHTSSIVVDIRNIEARLKLQDDEQETTPRRSKSKVKRPRSPGPSTARTEKRSSLSRQASPSGEDESEFLPTPQDLAKSFLEDESAEERKQLEAALNARSVDLSQSVASSDGGSDERPSGTGIGIMLPGFLAAFLKGIGDRLQVTVKNLTIKLETNLQLPPEDGLRLFASGHTCATTFSICVEDLIIQDGSAVKIHMAENATKNQPCARPAACSSETRRIELQGITAAVTTDTALLDSLSQAFEKAGNLDRSQNIGHRRATDSVTGSPNLSGPSLASESSEVEGSPPGTTHEESEVVSDSITSDSGHHLGEFINASIVDSLDHLRGSVSADSSASVTGLTAEDLLAIKESSVAHSGHLYDAVRSFQEERGSPPRRFDRKFRQLYSPLDSPRQPPPQELSSSSLNTLNTSIHNRLEEAETGFLAAPNSEVPVVFEDSAETPVNENLEKSKFFSHEEAESIYLSAINVRDPLPDGAPKFPGQWEDQDDPVTSSGTTRHIVPTPDPSSNQDISMPRVPLDDPEGASLPSPSVTTRASGYEEEHVGSSRPTQSPIPFPGAGAFAVNVIHLSNLRLDFCKGSSGDPSETDQPGPSPSFGTASEYRSVPGAFSVYAETTSKRTGSSSVTFTDRPRLSKEQQIPAPASPATQPTTKVTLGRLEIRTDVATALLFLQLSRKLQSALEKSSPKNEKRTVERNEPQLEAIGIAGLSIHIQDLTLAFTENLRFPGPSKSPPKDTSFTLPDDALFVLKLASTTVSISDAKQSSLFKLIIGSFRFGFPDEDILSAMDRRSRHNSILSSSKRDRHHESGSELTMEIVKTDDALNIHLTTQPLVVDLDIHKIDSTLGSIGGLSGLLELGSSIMSDSTVLSPSPRKRGHARTVRFDASTKQPADTSSNSQTRLNARIGGSSITLRGQSCSIRFESSAIKLVSRSTLMGVQVDEMTLRGPFVQNSPSEPALLFRARDTRLKFLPVPEEHDLTRLISLLTPSKDKFEEDDDFLIDTLIKQRKRGAVLKCNISRIDAECLDTRVLGTVHLLNQEISKLSAVTKYLPQETRPGLMTLATIDAIAIGAETKCKLGRISIDLASTEIAHVSAPALVAVAVGKLLVQREVNTPLVSAVLPVATSGGQPMLMARVIEDELEPTIKLKFWNTCFDYSVALLTALAETVHSHSHEDAMMLSRGASLSDIITGQTDLPHSDVTATPLRPEYGAKPLKLDIAFRDCAIGLNPHQMPSKALFILGDAAIIGSLPEKDGIRIRLALRKADLLIIDDVQRVEKAAASPDRSQSTAAVTTMVRDLCKQGFVSVSSISAAQGIVMITPGTEGEAQRINVEFKDELFVLETCADSQQTLIDTLNALKPSSPPSTGQKYRTEVAPVEDMMASFSGEAFPISPREQAHTNDDAFDHAENSYDDDAYDDAAFHAFEDSSATEHNSRTEVDEDELEESIYKGFDLGDLTTSELSVDIDSNHLNPLVGEREVVEVHDIVTGSFHPDPLPPQAFGQARKWDSANNRYLPVTKLELARCPIQVHIQDVHIIWNLYDGYDWERTRDIISRAVQDVEIRAEEKRRSRRVPHEEDEKESVIGDFLFNSIYIGVPANQDPKDLSRHIIRDMDDLFSETTSHTQSHTPSYSSTATSRPSSSHRPQTPGRRLKLDRSKRHKIAFELRGVSVDVFMFEHADETQSSVDVRIADFEIFDHVPTSTWKKFATYMHDAGPREDQKPMVHLEICDVRPMPELTASELVIRATVLPLRLHVDQDALDFITRFFDFRDIEKSSSEPRAEEPYLQRVEIRAVPVKLDYKPKKVDYAGLRSGRTSEFMNFFILDGAEFVLRHVILYGCSGFLKMHQSLEDIWMPDVKNNQLPSVLAGLNGLRTLVNVGTGMRDLIQIPIREYKKDGRIVRSISKGAVSFAQTTGGELTRFGAKLAIGAQTALQNAEGLFGSPGARSDATSEEAEAGSEERRTISHYANQPTGILQGLAGAARSLERDLLLTRDVIIAISGEVRDSRDVEGAARAVARHAPTLILRPMIGASRAVAQTLMGAGNSVDPGNKRRVEDKYKRY